MSDGSTPDTLTTTTEEVKAETVDGGVSVANAATGTNGENTRKNKPSRGNNNNNNNNNNGSSKATASKASNASKRRKLDEKGERKPWYCCSCKQTLKPEAFDPGLETCRVCLAKRRSKDRAKKRLRALQLKHHLLSADEKDVAAFLLGVYRPIAQRERNNHESSGPSSTQMHMTASYDVRVFVDEVLKYLGDKPQDEADTLIKTFLNKTENPFAGKGEEAAGSKGKRGKGGRKGARALSAQSAPKSEDFARDLHALYDKYDASLASSNDQTWVRFARADEVSGQEDVDIGLPIRYSDALHEDAAVSAESDENKDMISSLMQGADPTVSQFLYNLLFTEPEPPAAQTTREDAVNVSKKTSTTLRSGSSGESSKQTRTGFEFELFDGNSYAFKGSLVMGWVGRSFGENKKLYSNENGILPEDLHPQAIHRHGQLYDARAPGKLVPLEETSNLHGLSEDLGVYPVINSAKNEARVVLPAGSFSPELGIRVLRDGHYIDCDVRTKRQGDVEVILYPHGKGNKFVKSDAILGCVYLQCFVRSGAAKKLPIGTNLVVVMIPSAVHCDEIREGVAKIAEVRGHAAARQYLSSLGYVLEHGEPGDNKTQFVLETSRLLNLQRTVALLCRLIELSKLSDGSEDSRLSKSRSKKVDVTKAGAVSLSSVLARPLACLVAGIVHLLFTLPYSSVETFQGMACLMWLAAAATFSLIQTERFGPLMYTMYTIAFTIAHYSLMTLQGFAKLGQMHAYALSLAVTAALVLLSTKRSIWATVTSLAIPTTAFHSLGFNPGTIRTAMQSSLGDGVNERMLGIHSTFAHVAALGAPILTRILNNRT